MKILVTGGAGFIGAPLSSRLAEAGHDVVVWDKNVNAGLADQGIAQYDVDIADRAAVDKALAEATPEVIVHAAAVVGVIASVGAIPQTVNVNIMGSVNLFEAVVAQGGVTRLIDLSSEETYGDFPAEPLDEDDRGLPLSPYGITKYTVERLGNYYATVHGLPYVAARLSWVYGPFFPRQRIPQTWINAALEGRATTLPHGADQRIDFTHVDDIVAGLHLLVEADTLHHPAYHLATAQGVTLGELAAMMKEILPDWSVDLGPGNLLFSPGVFAATKGAMKIDRAVADLGYRPTVSLREGLERTIEHTRNQNS
jgi:nucleoside-diphosphate-sugar epimerase